MKILKINEHTLKAFEDRSNGRLLDFIYEENENNNLKIMYGYETRPDGKEFVKPILVVKNKWFLPMRIFEKEGIEYYKVLSVLYDIQYFGSINLNFGLHTDIKNIRFNIIDIKDEFFDDTFEYKDFYISFDNLSWKLETIEKVDNINKEFNISSTGRKNKVLEHYKLPLFIKTFRGKIIKLD
jgi:hypothetical protein